MKTKRATPRPLPDSPPPTYSLSFSRTRSDSLPLYVNVYVSVCSTLCSITVTDLSFQGGHGRHAPPCARASRSNQTSCTCACTYYAPELQAHLHESAWCTRHLSKCAVRVRLGELDVPSEGTQKLPLPKIFATEVTPHGQGREREVGLLATHRKWFRQHVNLFVVRACYHVLRLSACFHCLHERTNKHTHTHPHSITASHASTDARAHAHARVHTYRPGRLYCWQQLVSQL